MPKKLPMEAKNKAMKLYLEGDKSAAEIASTVEKEFKINVKPVTIYSWIKQYNWKDKLAEARTTAIAEVTESESARFARLQKEHLDTYESMRHKSKHELDSLVFDRAVEAARIADLSIQGERKVMEGLLSMQFVQDVLNIILDEVTDPQVIDRVAVRLRSLVTEE